MSRWIERPICSGPSKWELILALFEGKHVVFDLGSGLAEVTITGVEQCGDEQWNLKGHVIHWKRYGSFVASFNTGSRKGLLQPAPEK